MLFLFLLIFTTLAYAHAYGGYDSGGGAPGTCGRPYRAGRMHTPSCNLDEGFCRQAGDSYPWKAMRRFVRENQGLMRRMYGDQAEGSVLRGEFGRKMKFASPDLHKYSRRQEKDMENELYLNEEEEFEELLSEARYLKDADHRFESRYLRDEDVLNTKFVYSEEPTLTIKLAGLKTAAHFRPTTSSTSTTTENTSTSTTEDKNETVAATTDNNLVINDEDSENTTTASLREVEGDLPLPNDEEVGNSTASIIANKTILSTVINDILTTTSTTNISDRIDLESNTSDIKETVQISFQDEISLNDEATTLPSTKSDDNAQNSEKPNEYNKQPSEAPSGDTMLFQDMDSEEKVKVNYKLVGVNACPVKEEVVAPFWANNTRGEVLALLNMYPFEQYVHWEKCTFEHKQMYCRDGCRCEQQYRLHRLLAYDPNNECRGIFSDWFRFPSCCVCKCYRLPPEFRVTSRSPRNRDHWESDRNEN